MPKGKTEFQPLDSRGKPLWTVEDLSRHTGLSVWHIRERTRPNPRGKFIPSHKIGGRIYFDEVDALAAIYDSPKRTDTPKPKQVVNYI